MSKKNYNKIDLKTVLYMFDYDKYTTGHESMSALNRMLDMDDSDGVKIEAKRFDAILIYFNQDYNVTSNIFKVNIKHDRMGYRYIYAVADNFTGIDFDVVSDCLNDGEVILDVDRMGVYYM